MSDVPEKIIGEINQLYYDFKRIESIQSYRNLLTSSDIKLSTSVKKKIESCDWNITSFENFLAGLTTKERYFVMILISYGKILHCDIIGNMNHGARQHWEEIQKWTQEEITKYKKTQYFFLIVTLIVFLIIFYVINSYFKLLSDYCLIGFFAIVLTALIGFNSKAIILNKEKN